ncbi:MAG TPA: hypothetical protein VFX16_04195 [Pseudonocardiaceae bacterium]|nr:hypothetical protein [Pseudonocardiaceae bacterium]
MTTTSDHLADVSEQLAALAAAMEVWATRDVSKPQPQVRQAANDAMTALDTALDDLHELRRTLDAEMFEADRIQDARVNRILAQIAAFHSYQPNILAAIPQADHKTGMCIIGGCHDHVPFPASA